MKKKFLFLLIPILVLVVAVVLATIKWQQKDNNSFQNPGDYLNGGGTGEIAEPVDCSTRSEIVTTIMSQSDLTELAADTACESYTDSFVGTYDEVITISASGTYYFQVLLIKGL